MLGGMWCEHTLPARSVMDADVGWAERIRRREGDDGPGDW